MTSTKPYLRKKSVLIMYKVFLQFPEALRPAFPRLKEKLEDPDPGLYFFLYFFTVWIFLNF
jgi:AP-3 complex subunit delta-1